MVALLALFVASVWSDFPLNGNPITWLQAKDLYLDGVRYRSRFDLPAAVSKFQKCVAIYPRDAHFQFALAEALQRMGRFAESEKAFSQATELSPNHIDAWLRLSEVQNAQGKPKESEASCRKALSIDPNHSESRAQIALILLGKNQSEEAKKFFDPTVAKPRPNTGRYWFLAAQYWNALGDTGKARTDFIRAAHTSHNEPEYAEAAGMWLSNKGMVRDGVYWLKSASDINSSSAEYAENYGLALASCGLNKEALGPLKKAAALQPDNLQYAKNYAGVMHEMALYGDCVAYIHKLILENRADQQCWELLVGCLMQNTNYGQTKAALKEIMNETTGNNKAMAARYLGDVLQQQGNVDEAKQAYELALSFNPSRPLQDYLLKCVGSKVPTAAQ
jgi:tetratricopeptide (TPR) repeat protein